MEKSRKKVADKPKRSGRPPLPPESRKDRRLDDVRFSAAELAALRARAESAGLTWSEWVRSRLGVR
jgi:hypothetical protein